MGFQKRIRRQIMRFSLLLAAVFFVVSVGLLFLYSIYYNSYRAKNYNEMLCDDFSQVYEQYRSYLSTRGEGWSILLRCLDEEISGTALALSYRSFSRDCMVSSNLILTDQTGRVVSTTYDELTYSQEQFNAQVIRNTFAQKVYPYNTVYYYDSAPRYVFSQPIYDEEGTYRGVACLYLDMEGLIDNMQTLQYSGIIVHGASRVIVAADRRMVKNFNHFYGVEDGLFRLNGQEYWICSAALPATAGCWASTAPS